MTAQTHNDASSHERAARHPALRVAGGTLRVAWVLVRVGVIAGVVAILVLWHQFGYTPVAVQTGSMAPTMPPHTLLFVHEVSPASVRKGDVITFDPPGPVPRTSHRVVAIYHHAGQIYFRTKGDANPAPDDWRSSATMSPTAPDAPYTHAITYGANHALKTRWHVRHAGWLAQLDAVPHLRMLLFATPFVVVALQLLSWIWSSGEDDDLDPRDEGDEDEHDAACDDPLDEAA